MQGGEGTLGKCGAGWGWKDACGFLDGNGVGKSTARRDARDTQDGGSSPALGSFSKAGFIVRLQKTEGTSNRSKMVAGLFVSP